MIPGDTLEGLVVEETDILLKTPSAHILDFFLKTRQDRVLVRTGDRVKPGIAIMQLGLNTEILSPVDGIVRNIGSEGITVRAASLRVNDKGRISQLAYKEVVRNCDHQRALRRRNAKALQSAFVKSLWITGAIILALLVVGYLTYPKVLWSSLGYVVVIACGYEAFRAFKKKAFVQCLISATVAAYIFYKLHDTIDQKSVAFVLMFSIAAPLGALGAWLVKKKGEAVLCGVLALFSWWIFSLGGNASILVVTLVFLAAATTSFVLGANDDMRADQILKTLQRDDPGEATVWLPRMVDMKAVDHYSEFSAFIRADRKILAAIEIYELSLQAWTLKQAAFRRRHLESLIRAQLSSFSIDRIDSAYQILAAVKEKYPAFC